MKNSNFILLTIDVEDWFQVENFKQWIPFNTWSSHELRVEKNTHRFLDLFDTFVSTQKPKPITQNPEPATGKPIKATFFILGWIAERLPHLVREIHARGHEVASHGYNHDLCTECFLDDLKTDLIHSKKLLEDIIGDQIYGYRAPSFTMNNNILRIIQDCGYLYDSSYNSFNLHDRYSKITLDGIEKKGIAFKFSKNFFELPISNISLKKKHARLHKKRRIYENLIIPWGGGGYFRLVPFKFFKIGVQAILDKENVYLFYLHPWEIDPLQPRIKGAHLSYRFRHYSNQKKTYPKLLALIDHFRSCRFVSCAQYINSQVKANLE